MIADNNRKLSIIAYYFSKFDRDAMRQLGYGSLTDAFVDLSQQFGKDNGYLKLRRDEFDPLTGSHRQGFNKRNPNAVVENFHNGLKNYEFEELTEIVKTILDDERTSIEIPHLEIVSAKELMKPYAEEDIERIIDQRDLNSGIYKKFVQQNRCVFDDKIPNSLKALYSHKCQICGAEAMPIYGVDIAEAHHIEYFSLTANNDASNVMILCPDHHKIAHKTHAVFKREQSIVHYENGREEALMYNLHL